MRPSASVVCSTRPPGRLRASSDDDVRARLHQIACGAEAGESGAHDNHVGFHGGILS